MTFDELQKRAIKMFGRRWKIALAKELGKHLSALYRWEKRGVPHYVDMWFELHEQRRKMERFAKSLTK